MVASAAETDILALSGPITLTTLDEVRGRLGSASRRARIDLSAVTELDTAGAWALTHYRKAGMHLTGARASHELLLHTVAAAMPGERPVPPRPALYRPDLLSDIGEWVCRVSTSAVRGLGFVGLVMARLVGTILHPRRLRVTALVHHMQAAGLNAVPIVALMGFMIGVVLAFQGATQLRQFGAEVFVVDLIAVSILRELGILLTAIIVAGRSASAFTAAIGSMKMREEIDAMRVLGLDPIELLVLPRLLALVILLPILGLIANVAGLFGGAMMAWVELGISPGQFRSQLLASVTATQALVGLSKAPVFAVIIALVGCHQGLLVKGDAESLGQRTSQAVVMAIFMVIVVDGLFSVFFAIWGV